MQYVKVKMKMQEVKIYRLEDELELVIRTKKAPPAYVRSGTLYDLQIERDLYDDIEIPENETEEARVTRVKRYQNIVSDLKEKYNHECQICGSSFPMDNGIGYCEAHHIKMLSENGSQTPDNVIILCANHHRMFHYAKDSIKIEELVNGKRIIKICEEEFTIQF